MIDIILVILPIREKNSYVKFYMVILLTLTVETERWIARMTSNVKYYH